MYQRLLTLVLSGWVEQDGMEIWASQAGVAAEALTAATSVLQRSVDEGKVAGAVSRTIRSRRKASSLASSWKSRMPRRALKWRATSISSGARRKLLAKSGSAFRWDRSSASIRRMILPAVAASMRTVTLL